MSRLRISYVAGVLGLTVSALMLVWLPLGVIESVPSMVDVFGMDGLRVPASCAVGGLLLAAVGFNKW